jgi:hypothetical protein
MINHPKEFVSGEVRFRQHQRRGLFMDFIDTLLDKLRELTQKIIDALLGPEVQPEPELIPIPVDRSRY